jgi:hypothetical protein
MRFALLAALLGLMPASAPAANILPNPSFETWIGSVPLGWVTSELLFPGSATRDSNSHTGTYCVRLVGGDTAAFATSGTIARAGSDYHFSGFVQVPGLLGGSFLLQFTTIVGSVIGSPELLPAYYSGSDYREYERWVTAPDSAALISVSFATLPGETACLDDVTLDDTTLAVAEAGTAIAVVTPTQPGKLVPLTSKARVAPGAALYDPLGRRVHGRPARGGIYLVPPQREGDR